MTLFVGLRSFISLPSFMFVSAAVSEICESNREKKNHRITQYGSTVNIGMALVWPALSHSTVVLCIQIN